MGEVNVVQAVEDCLRKFDKQVADKWRRCFPTDLTNADLREQLEQVNRFWRIELGQLEQSTVEERECLIEDIAFHDWYRNFERDVAPTIVGLWGE